MPAYTAEIAEKILNLIRLGNSREIACAAVGVDGQTLVAWQLRGARGKEPHKSFCASMAEAEASAEARHVATVFQASRTDWRASAWVVEERRRRAEAERARVGLDAWELDMDGPIKSG